MFVQPRKSRCTSIRVLCWPCPAFSQCCPYKLVCSGCLVLPLPDIAIAHHIRACFLPIPPRRSHLTKWLQKGFAATQQPLETNSLLEPLVHTRGRGWVLWGVSR